MTGTLKFTIEVGRLVRKDMERLLRTKAYNFGLDIDIQNKGGFLWVTWFVTLRGEVAAILAYKAFVEDLKQRGSIEGVLA